MSLERVRRLVARWREIVSSHAPPEAAVAMPMDAHVALDLFESMLLARHLDVAAHELRAAGHGHYTICSSGHEGNVVLGRLTTTTDPTLLHYRSAAVQIERSRQVPDTDAVRDIALGLVASSEEPMSGGRHKLFGSKALGIIPQTSTIASHLPRAVGLAFALDRRPRLGLEAIAPDDAIAVASFGDASINHSTALGAANAASWVVHQNLRLPLLFVCEDNGLGISVRSPNGWVETRLRALPHFEYFSVEGWRLGETWRVASEAVAHCRRTRRPALLHLRCVRLLGHAGSDVDTTYRSPAELEEAERQDPVLCAALELLDARIVTPEQALRLDAAARERVAAEAERAAGRPKLSSRREVMRALSSPAGEQVDFEGRRRVGIADHEPNTLAQGINAVLGEALERYPEALIFGQDVAKKGGVYGITKGLLGKGGPARVFNTLLDEQTILGLALGCATLGLLPVPEIQYLAYLHNAEDQLRGEAATLQFFSNLAYDNPFVLRIAGLAYQKGFGGHFHNDDSIAVLRDIPGIALFVPARADDAIELYRTAFALARVARRVVVAIEPIALYHTRDLHAEGDREWLAPAPATTAPYGRARLYNADGRDLTIATYGNGLHLSLRAAHRLQKEHGIHARVLDLRWLAPLPIDDVLLHASQTGRLLVVDECRKSGGISEALAAGVLERRLSIRFERVTSADSFIPLGEAAQLVLVSESEVVDAGRRLVG